MHVLVTGGAGYIGSHTCVALGEQGFNPVVFDNLCNASRESVRRAGVILGREIPFIEGDVRDRAALLAVMERHRIDSVVHFAALKVMGESVAMPLPYFDNNISGTIVLLQAMREAGIKDLVFSSSATVYGEMPRMPVDESAPVSSANPYGRTKLVMEQLIADVCASDKGLGAVLLRYFNPVGAHESGVIGEDPRGTPSNLSNLMPCVAQVAVGRREKLQIFGGDWPTRDGTGIRDYIHVMDLARAHVAALRHLWQGHRGALTLNAGTGTGTTVLELLTAFERACGKTIEYEIAPRRAGDVAQIWASTERAHALLDWRAEHDIERMCEDVWRWQSQNPYGYA